ncbi:MAG: FAD-dependent oxidoreductase [Planctomycetes bacterium]|nr:FAD-dependent oxidoreductase [Planctomycetota bacterium]
MITLTIDNKTVQVPEGSTILDAANKLGIEIPSMCFLKDFAPSTSCMVCVVKVNDSDTLIPSCATLAAESMKVQSDIPHVIKARKTAIELLLSDHVGDCLGPCHVTCPAKMNIPLMIRQIAEGKFTDAIKTVKKDIPLPAVLGRICPAPCEKACRRSKADGPVSICLLKRFVADIDIESPESYLPEIAPSSGKHIAIIGAGPAGLSTAYYLAQKGHKCTVFDDHDKAGGMLRYGVDRQKLPHKVLDAEIALTMNSNIIFKNNTRIGSDISIEEVKKDFDAIFIATGTLDQEQAELLGLKLSSKGTVEINSETYQTENPKIFAGGNAISKTRLAVRSVAHGKEAANSIDLFLLNKLEPGAVVSEFNHRMKRLLEGEIETFMASADKTQRIEPSQVEVGFNSSEAKSDSHRCLHCDCRKVDSCKLKNAAQQFQAKSNQFDAPRKHFIQYYSHPDIIYEPGKCIDCGLCIQTAQKQKEGLGLTFIGRGFDVKVSVPFDKSIEQALKTAALSCAANCPTGALAPKHNDN